ncbi:MAG: SPOR domain-containing protein [Bacteroidales bacterium]|nr:SPOR domain-containing protein [Bacteroidales bacterium]
MPKIIFSVLALVILFSFKTMDGDKPSKARIHQSPEIEKIVEKHKKINEKYGAVAGFRVQIFSVSGANSRDRANLMKAEFLTKYPDSEVYIVYNAPAYKVRIGDFRTKLEALKFIQTIKDNYPFAFVAVDEVILFK